MFTIEVCYGSHRINRFTGEDALENAREDAQDYADRTGLCLSLVNGTPGEPRYLLEAIESATCCESAS